LALGIYPKPMTPASVIQLLTGICWSIRDLDSIIDGETKIVFHKWDIFDTIGAPYWEP